MVKLRNQVIISQKIKQITKNKDDYTKNFKSIIKTKKC